MVNIIPSVSELQREVLTLRKRIYPSYPFKTWTLWLEDDLGYQLIPVMSVLHVRPMKWLPPMPPTSHQMSPPSRSLRAWTALVL